MKSNTGTESSTISRADCSRRFVLGALGCGGAVGLLGLLSGLAATTRARAQVPPPAGVESNERVQAFAARLGYNLEKIFAFVAEEIAYEPYAGVLRGALGTLWGRAGNSADQAVLLAALLEASGRNVRFVTGALPAAQAARLLGTAALDLASTRAHAMSFLRGNASAEGATPPPETYEAARALAADLPELAAALVAAGNEQLDGTVRTIRDALDRAGVELPTDLSSLPERERMQHVWVQVARGQEWVDLDPTIPNATIGASATAVTATLDRLPDDLRHRLRFTVTHEQIAGDRLTQSTSLEHQVFADELTGAPVTFFNAKTDGLAGLGIAISGLLDGAAQYVPTLLLGNVQIVGTRPLSFGAPANGGGALGGVFGGASGSDGQATAQWVDITITAVDRDPVTVRREIFDRIGYAERAGGAVTVAALPAVRLVDLSSEVRNEYPPCRTIMSFAVTGGPLNGEYYVRDYRGGESPADLSLVSGTCHYMREGLNALLAAARGVRGFCDMPNVISYTLVPGAPVNGEVPVFAGIDIWHRSFGVLPVPGTPLAAPPTVIAGVLSHVAERLTAGEGLPGNSAAAMIGVGTVFDAARAQNIGIRALRSPIDASTLGAHSPQARLRMAAGANAGYVVVVPDRPATVGGRPYTAWWLVDPVTGRTVDETENGWGATTGEYVYPLTTEYKIYLQFLRVAACVAKYGAMAGLLIGLEGEAFNIAGDAGMAAFLAAAAKVASEAAKVGGSVTSLC